MLRTHRRPNALSLLLIMLLIMLLGGCAGFGGGDEPPVEQVWRVVEIDGEALPRLPDGRAPTLELARDPLRASGFGGCNRISSSYLLDGEGLSFGLLASTRMACEPPASAVEASYLQALQSVTRWRRREGGLELLDAAGTVRVRLVPAGRIDPLPEP